MSTELEIKNRIMESATEMFLKSGISKVTMEEISDELAMSKKTIYKFFASKEILIHEILESKKRDTNMQCQLLLRDENMDFVEKLKKIMTFIGLQYSKWSPQFVEDMRKNMPEIWKDLSEWRQKTIMKDFGDLVHEGVQKRVFRNDVNESIFVLIYLGAIQFIVNPIVLSQFSFSASDAFDTIIKVIYEGMFTEEARAKYISLETEK